jgi:cell division protease FtsH
MMTVALGGRVAEEVVYGEAEVTTGAASDLQQVARIARNMVTRFGMSDRLGNVALGRQYANIFLGREIAAERDFSEETAALIDEEVRRLVNEAYQRATYLIRENRALLDRIARRLVEAETIDGEELQAIIESSEVVMLPPEEEEPVSLPVALNVNA